MGQICVAFSEYLNFEQLQTARLEKSHKNVGLQKNDSDFKKYLTTLYTWLLRQCYARISFFGHKSFFSMRWYCKKTI